MMRRSLQGVTLAELLLATALLFLSFSILFVLVNRGQKALNSSSTRDALQATLMTLKLSLQSDFGRTALGSVTIANSPSLSDRDSVSCVVLDDWSDPSHFPATRLGPQWNQRVTYVNGLGEEGALDRIVFVPEEPLELRSVPIATVWPRPESEWVSRHHLSGAVSSFVASVEPEDELVVIQVHLGERLGETVSGRFVFAPSNTRDYI